MRPRARFNKVYAAARSTSRSGERRAANRVSVPVRRGRRRESDRLPTALTHFPAVSAPLSRESRLMIVPLHVVSGSRSASNYSSAAPPSLRVLLTPHTHTLRPPSYLSSPSFNPRDPSLQPAKATALARTPHALTRTQIHETTKSNRMGGGGRSTVNGGSWVGRSWRGFRSFAVSHSQLLISELRDG
uniref:Uncharacterized protein n=1 Tax=Plectus sambesii TaxID=2011161 RepID=A0A914VRD0_9BILA